jgi:glycosyltransferase involved in cell wall biosynthesis
MRAEYLSPGHDPEMDQYAQRVDREVDVVFVGGYSRHHRRRAEVLELVAQKLAGLRVVYHLDRSKMTLLAETPLGLLLGLSRHRRPRAVAAVSSKPVFGRDLYEALSGAKIVINGAVDMAGADRGNMRCFEALGCGALMVSDRGAYPEGMVEGETMLGYDSGEEAASVIAKALADPERLKSIAARGAALVRDRYSKQQQWMQFCSIVERL